MTTLRPGIENILRVFYTNRDNKIHVRELARRTKLHGQSIMRYLQQLEGENILKSEKEGNLKKYFLNHNKRVYSLLTLFDMERFEKLPLLRKKAIKHYLHKLEEKPILVVLFGSTAKNTSREDSDIDLLIITNHKIKTKEAEKEADALAATKISTFQIEYEPFKRELKLKEDPVIQSALFSGYPIFNNIAYYEEIYEGI